MTFSLFRLLCCTSFEPTTSFVIHYVSMYIQAMKIAAEICVFTNDRFVIDTMKSAKYVPPAPKIDGSTDASTASKSAVTESASGLSTSANGNSSLENAQR